MDELVQRAAELEDADIERLPFFLRWPVKMALGFFLSVLINGFAFALGTIFGMAVHGQVMCSWVGECLGPLGVPFRPAMSLLSPELGLHLPGLLAEAALCVVIWALANLAVLFGVRHNAGSRLAAAVPGAVLGLAWMGWYGLVIGASWLAS